MDKDRRAVIVLIGQKEFENFLYFIIVYIFLKSSVTRESGMCLAFVKLLIFPIL